MLSPRNSQHSSPAPHLEIGCPLVVSFPNCPCLTPIRCNRKYWCVHNLDLGGFGDTPVLQSTCEWHRGRSCHCHCNFSWSQMCFRHVFSIYNPRKLEVSTCSSSFWPTWKSIVFFTLSNNPYSSLVSVTRFFKSCSAMVDLAKEVVFSAL